jgi:hypothetical protein
MTTTADVARWAPLVTAVRDRARITYIDPHGSTETGTLRYFCPPREPLAGMPVDGYLRHDADLETATVRITTRSGWERWEDAAFLADALARHELRVES